MKRELETPLNEAIDSCNIQRKQYQHTETAYFKHVDVFHASRHSEKKTKLGKTEVNLEGKLRRSSIAVKSH